MFIILPLTFHYKDEGTLTEKGKEKTTGYYLQKEEQESLSVC